MLEHLRQVIGLRGYGQRDPLNEYKAEAFNLFEAMIAKLREARHRAADAGRDRAAAAAGGAAELALHGGAPDRSARPARTRLAPARRWRRRWPATATARARARNPNDPDDLGQGRPQRGVPVRLGQEIQALPRALRVDASAAHKRNGREIPAVIFICRPVVGAGPADAEAAGWNHRCCAGAWQAGGRRRAAR